MRQETTNPDKDITLYSLQELETMAKRHRGNYSWHIFTEEEVCTEIRKRKGEPTDTWNRMIKFIKETKDNAKKSFATTAQVKKTFLHQ